MNTFGELILTAKGQAALRGGQCLFITDSMEKRILMGDDAHGHELLATGCNVTVGITGIVSTDNRDAWFLDDGCEAVLLYLQTWGYLADIHSETLLTPSGHFVKLKRDEDAQTMAIVRDAVSRDAIRVFPELGSAYIVLPGYTLQCPLNDDEVATVSGDWSTVTPSLLPEEFVEMLAARGLLLSEEGNGSHA